MVKGDHEFLRGSLGTLVREFGLLRHAAACFTHSLDSVLDYGVKMALSRTAKTLTWIKH